MLSPHRLRVLQAVVAARSVHGAARNLHYAPATVSQHMSALARETGLVLFTKDGRGVRPTSAALKLAEQAEEALSTLDRLGMVVEDLRQGRSTRLAIATFSSAAEQWLPEVVRSARRQDQETTVEISLNEPSGGGGRRPADIDLRNESPDDAAQHFEGYTRVPLCVEEFAVVLPEEHRLAALRSVPMQELRDEMWVDHDIYDSPTGRIVLAGCQAAGFTPRFAARLDDHHAALSLVAAGLGVAVLPRLALARLPEGAVTRPLVRPRVQRRIVAHIRQETAANPVVTAALASLQHQAAAVSSLL